MSKMIDATCEGGVVTADGVPVDAAVILSEGVASSEGILILDEDLAKYVTSNALDLKETLDKIASSLEKIASALSAIDGAGYIISVSGGAMAPAIGVPSPPVATSDIAAINSLKSEIETLMENLR